VEISHYQSFNATTKNLGIGQKNASIKKDFFLLLLEKATAQVFFGH